MSSFLKRNAVLTAVIAMIVVMCTSLICFTVSEKHEAAAASAFTEEDSVSIGHITDTHYYSLRLCYTDGAPINTTDPDYFYNYVMDKSTKLWLESEAAFDASMKTFAEQMPDYVVLSGDCAQDGELLGHIDLANKLRKLQNTVREVKPDFQVFVVMGNHDLYNPETYRFDVDGMKKTFYYTTRLEVAKIYAGLGYPNMTEAEANEFYAPLKAMDGGILMPSDRDYVRSNLSSAFNYAWEFLKKDGSDTRVFSFSGADDPAHDTVTMANFINDGWVNLIDNTVNFQSSGLCYTYENFHYGMDIDVGQLTGIQARKDGKFSFITADVIISNAVDEHVLGGQLQNETMEWLTANKSIAKPSDDTTIAAASHHSIIPHWDMEEEITTGFIVYNPVEIADFLADYGVRYVYTGHQHANDKASYISTSGNQIIDMEGAANVSVGSQVKITTVARGNVGGTYAEKATLKAYPNKKIDITTLYDKVLKDDKYGYVAKNKVSEFVNASDKTITDYSKYARRRVYDNIVDNYMNKFLQKSIVDSLGDMVKGIAPIKIGLTIDIAKYSDDVVKVVNNLIAGINEKVLKDYSYEGNTARMKSADMKVFAYLEDLVNRVLSLDLSGEGDKVLDVFMDCYMRHCTGEDWASAEAMFAENPSYEKAFKNIKSGKFVNDLIEVLLDDEQGLMFLIKGLSETTFDLSTGVSSDFKGLIDSVCTILGVKDEEGNNISLSKFNLGTLVKSVGGISMVTDLIDNFGIQIDLANMSIPEIIDDIVSKYLTDNFKQGLGEYAYRVICGFGIDGGHNDVVDSTGAVMKVAEYADEEVTYVKKARQEIITIENGKLPSMLTNNFGDDVATTRNFTYYTDRRITDGAIQYTTDTENHTKATTRTALTKVYGTTKPLIDLGIWCQSGYTEIARHTVELTGLTPGTTYAYRAGSPSKNYWSEWYTFTTGAEDGKFEALISSDVQSSTQSAYQRIAAIQKDVVEEQFGNGVSFLINPGDLVDNGRNLSQYKWLYDADQSFYASYASVVAAGNHDSKYFTLEKAGSVDYYGGVSAGAYTSEYNYLWTHYNYGIPSGQVSDTGFYYSFDYGKVHFAVLNTNDIESVTVDGKKVKQLAKKQYDWLENDLVGSEADYKVIIMHKALYSEGSHSYDSDVVGMRAQLTPLFAEKGVNLVIAGHDHVYNETFYIDADGQKVSTDANGKNEIGKEGTLYVTMGCMGEKFYNFVDNENITTATGASLHKDGHLSDPTFGKLVFDGEKLYYYGYQYLREFDEDGNLIGGESVFIKKASNELIGIIVAASVAGIVVISLAGGIAVAVIKKKKGN
ncbi:MAG: metallophosphoesterase [Christensenellales bacterium]